jgi:hypothetical protein
MNNYLKDIIKEEVIKNLTPSITGGVFCFSYIYHYMKIEISKLQYQRVVYKLLDALYGPNISFKKDDDIFEILSDNGEEIFRLYTKEGRSKGCKRDMLVLTKTIEEIKMFFPPAVLRKKLFSKTIISYVNEKTNLDIDCIDFAYEIYDNDETYLETKYRFNVKKNKKTRSM